MNIIWNSIWLRAIFDGETWLLLIFNKNHYFYGYFQISMYFLIAIAIRQSSFRTHPAH